jgi:hypothetical protein
MTRRRGWRTTGFPSDGEDVKRPSYLSTPESPSVTSNSVEQGRRRWRYRCPPIASCAKPDPMLTRTSPNVRCVARPM